METSNAIEITPYDTPWEIACMLINTKHRFKTNLGEEVVSTFFDKEELRRIGEHLIGYCNAEREETK